MADILIYPIGTTSACGFASRLLAQKGFRLVDHPTPDATHLLLDVPSFSNDGMLRGGGNIERILEMLPRYIRLIGGGLDHPAVENYRHMDLLTDECYLASNSAITAECALQIAAPLMTHTFSGSSVLIIGWGRIGKCLSKLLKSIGADVTVTARNPRDRAMLTALGYHAVDTDNITGNYHMIYNTVPSPVLNRQQLSQWKDCIKIDLASNKGLEGDGVIWARGLPGIHAPESSGQLIADTILRLIREE